MKSRPEKSNRSVEDKVAAIVAEGRDVRNKVSEVVADGADKSPAREKGLIEISRSVLDGAVEALDKSVSPDPESVLRQVIDGLGDGLSAAALATRLAMDEARAEEKRFADEDLSRMTKDLRAVRDRFVDAVSRASKSFQSKSRAEVEMLQRHAEQAMKRLVPSIDSALASISEHPLQFGAESVEAGFQMSRQAVGSLFAAIGRQLEKAGKQLIGEKSP
jgi:uncharacterized protein DUF6781